MRIDRAACAAPLSSIDGARSMQQLRQILIPVLILAAGGGGYYGLTVWKQSPPRVDVPYVPPLVETSSASAFQDSFPIRVHGEVVPYREIRIAAEVSGRIVKKHERLRGGRFVEAETALLTIDPAPYTLEVERLGHQERQAQLEEQRAMLEEKHAAKLIGLAERRLELANEELKRLQSLGEQVTSTQAERDEAERSVLQIQDVLTVLENRRETLPLQLAEIQARGAAVVAQKKRAELDLSKTEIVAPLSAIVTADPHEVGSYVEAGDHLLTLQDTSQFEISCRLRSEDLLWLQDSGSEQPAENENSNRASFEIPERPATVTFRSGDETFQWEGRLARTDGMGFDPTTRTVACRVLVERPLQAEGSRLPSLVDGLFVQVEIEVTPRTELLAIPRDALQPDGQVWVVSGDKLKVHRVRPVRITESIVLLRPDRTEILPGARVVTSTLPIAYDGMDVRERPAP